MMVVGFHVKKNSFLLLISFIGVAPFSVYAMKPHVLAKLFLKRQQAAAMMARSFCAQTQENGSGLTHKKDEGYIYSLENEEELRSCFYSPTQSISFQAPLLIHLVEQARKSKKYHHHPVSTLMQDYYAHYEKDIAPDRYAWITRLNTEPLDRILSLIPWNKQKCAWSADYKYEVLVNEKKVDLYVRFAHGGAPHILYTDYDFLGELEHHEKIYTSFSKHIQEILHRKKYSLATTLLRKQNLILGNNYRENTTIMQRTQNFFYNR